MRRSWLVIILGLTVITGGVTTAQAGQDFTTDCFPSHRAPDDPIVFPGQPGASHSHDFFGNTTTDASSTYASMRSLGEQLESQRHGRLLAPTLLARDGTRSLHDGSRSITGTRTPARTSRPSRPI